MFLHKSILTEKLNADELYHVKENGMISYYYETFYTKIHRLVVDVVKENDPSFTQVSFPLVALTMYSMPLDDLTHENISVDFLIFLNEYAYIDENLFLMVSFMEIVLIICLAYKKPSLKKYKRVYMAPL